MNWDVYDRLINAYGDNESDRATAQAKETFLLEAIDNPGYHPNCKRNGVPQRFLIERTDVPYKAKFVTFPDEEIFPGDLIEVGDLIYLVTDPPRFLDRVNWAAIGRLCNLNLNWQVFGGRICSSPVCLDAGVYSTTMNGTDTVQSPDKQFKLYLPFNDDTAMLYLDQRIAVDTRYDKHGNKILECYRITGMNRVARSYGEDGHLLVCELRSSNFSPEHDNVEAMICDYVTPPTEETSTTAGTCRINGRNKIRIGRTQQYTVAFFDESGNTIANESAVWMIDTEHSDINLMFGDNPNVVFLSAAKNEDLIGSVVTITVTSADGETASSMEVEVIS